VLTISAIVARYAFPIWSPPRLLIVVVSISLLELQIYYFVFRLRFLQVQLQAESYLDFEIQTRKNDKIKFTVMSLCFITNAVKCYTEVTLASQFREPIHPIKDSTLKLILLIAYVTRILNTLLISKLFTTTIIYLVRLKL
jgi:hypothetical protein